MKKKKLPVEFSSFFDQHTTLPQPRTAIILLTQSSNINKVNMMFCYTKCTIAILTLALILSHTSVAIAQSASPRKTVDPSPSVTPSASLTSSAQPTSSPRGRDTNSPVPSSTLVRNEVSTKMSELTTARIEKVRALTKKMTTRLEAAQSRQENLLGRIDSRIGKLKELKANTVTLDRQVTSLQQTLTQQAALISAITPNLDKALSTPESTEHFARFKESVSKAVTQLTTTQATLNKLFDDLKSLSARISPLPVNSASSSITPSASVTSTLRPSPSPRVRTQTEE